MTGTSSVTGVTSVNRGINGGNNRGVVRGVIRGVMCGVIRGVKCDHQRVHVYIGASR